MDAFSNVMGSHRGAVNPRSRASAVRGRLVRGTDLLKSHPKTEFERADANIAAHSTCAACSREGLCSEHYYDPKVHRFAVAVWLAATVALIVVAHLLGAAGPAMLVIPIAAVTWHAVGVELGRRTLLVCPDCDWAHAYVNHSGLFKLDVAPPAEEK